MESDYRCTPCTGKEALEDEKLQAIYDLEENISLSWFWDSGVEAKIGHSCYGFEKEKNFSSVKEAIDWLYAETVGKVK